MNVQERFWAKVDKSNACWNWTASTTSAGYGQIRVAREVKYAHRLSYEWLVGEIPAGLELDHVCRNRKCVNPEHLEAVDRYTNFIRGEHPVAVSMRTGRCARGHDLGDAYVDPSGGRRCRNCRRVCGY